MHYNSKKKNIEKKKINKKEIPTDRPNRFMLCKKYRKQIYFFILPYEKWLMRLILTKRGKHLSHHTAYNETDDSLVKYEPPGGGVPYMGKRVGMDLAVQIRPYPVITQSPDRGRCASGT